MTEDTKTKLVLFVERAKELRSSSLFQRMTEGNLTYRVHWDVENGSRHELEGFETEQLVYASSLIRPFVSEEEPLFLPHIHNLLFTTTALDESLTQDLKNARSLFDKIMHDKTVGISIHGEPYPANRIWDLFFNGKFFHVDKELRIPLEKALQPTSGFLVRHQFNIMIANYVGLILWYARIIEQHFLINEIAGA